METLKPLRVVSCADPALDWIQMSRDFTGSDAKYVTAIEEYRAGRDPAMVREMPGRKLTWFTVKRLDAAIMDLVLSEPNEHAKYRMAFKYGVSRIENLTGLDGNERARVEGEDERMVNGIPTPTLSESQMAWVAPQYVEEIGGIAFARSFLAPTTAARYPRPRSWRLLLEAKISQVVAETAASLRQAAREKRQAEESTGPSGEPATDAPATAGATDDGTPL